MSEKEIRDFVIIGGGPAGITAAIYATRGLLDCVILEAATIGGQLNWTQSIENYPGYTHITGFELIQKFQGQLESLNVDIQQFQEIQSVNLTEKIKEIKTLEKTYLARGVLICTGSSPRKLGIPGEKELTGRGVSYCAVCDGAFFKDKVITTVGGGNSAIEESLYLTKYASKVYIVHRRDQLRASKVYQEKVLSNPKIEVLWDSIPLEIQGENSVNNLVIKNVKTGEVTNHKTDAVFPYIGSNPNTGLFKDQIELDERGHLLCNANMETNITGVYGAGDVRKTNLRQLVVSASDGAIAATSAIKYIDEAFQERSVPA